MKSRDRRIRRRVVDTDCGIASLDNGAIDERGIAGNLIERSQRDRLAGNDDTAGIGAWANQDCVAISSGIDCLLDGGIVLGDTDRAGRRRRRFGSAVVDSDGDWSRRCLVAGGVCGDRQEFCRPVRQLCRVEFHRIGRARVESADAVTVQEELHARDTDIVGSDGAQRDDSGYLRSIRWSLHDDGGRGCVVSTGGRSVTGNPFDMQYRRSAWHTLESFCCPAAGSGDDERHVVASLPAGSGNDFLHDGREVRRASAAAFLVDFGPWLGRPFARCVRRRTRADVVVDISEAGRIVGILALNQQRGHGATLFVRVEFEIGAGDNGAWWNVDAGKSDADLLVDTAIAVTVPDHVQVGALQSHRTRRALLCVVSSRHHSFFEDE